MSGFFMFKKLIYYKYKNYLFGKGWKILVDLIYNKENYSIEEIQIKFIKRFQYLENKAGQLGKSLADMTLAEMDVFWEEAKKV